MNDFCLMQNMIVRRITMVSINRSRSLFMAAMKDLSFLHKRKRNDLLKIAKGPKSIVTFPIKQY